MSKPTTARAGWITADLDGLARLVEDRSRAFVIYELVSNALDEDVRRIDITLEKLPRQSVARLVVADDSPDGFHDLSHAWTLFAESRKKDKAEKRGRFNMGEKLVLALCQQAKITTTTGTVHFDAGGRRFDGRQKTNAGSRFEALVRMTSAQFKQCLDEMQWILLPEGVEVHLNGVRLEPRTPVSRFEVTLPTVIGDADGVLRRSRRKTEIAIYEPRAGEPAMIYELGIPVVETQDRYHVDVGQKVPLNSDRDNVTPSFLKEVRAAVLNHTYSLLDETAATSGWVSDALAQKSVTAEAVTAVVEKRFGKKTVINDLSDREATNRAASLGYNVVHGGSFSSEQWENIKRARALHPAGQVFPTPRPLFGGLDPSTDLEIPRAEWTEGMHQVVALTHRLATRLMGITISVRILSSPEGFRACYGGRELSFNLRQLGRGWFANWRDNLQDVLSLLLDEYAHESSSNHLHEDYYRALKKLGSGMAVLALEEPTIYDPLPADVLHAA